MRDPTDVADLERPNLVRFAHRSFAPGLIRSGFEQALDALHRRQQHGALFTAKHKRRRKQMSTEAMQVCQRFPWPGNVRQLRNMVERVVITSREATIEVADLPDFLRAHDQSANAFSIRPGMTLAEVERLLIRQTLTHVTDNRAEAARVLGISRRALQYKLKAYGLLPESEPSSER